MRPYILPTFLIILEILYFIYILARENNENFRERVQKIRIRILEKKKFEEVFESYDPSIKKYNIYLSVLLLTQVLIIILTVVCLK